jgi:hypothetical protein
MFVDFITNNSEKSAKRFKEYIHSLVIENKEVLDKINSENRELFTTTEKLKLSPPTNECEYDNDNIEIIPTNTFNVFKSFFQKIQNAINRFLLKNYYIQGNKITF